MLKTRGITQDFTFRCCHCFR